MPGPLSGLRVVELQGRGPGPFGAMILADLGADVIRIARLEDLFPADQESGTERMIRGHDINYVALAGALDPLRRAGEPPAPPLNLLGDYGGGGMLAVAGILSALFERSCSGLGQVVDASMIDGVALLTTLLHGMRAEGLWSDIPGSNVLDLGAPFYNVYETADGRYLTVGCGEPQFYAELLERLGLGDELLHAQSDPATWPEGKARLAGVFKTRPLDEWCALLEGTNTCFAPVLTLAEAPAHPHNVEHGTFGEVDGVVQPAAAPRFSRTPAAVTTPPPAAGQHTTEVLLEWGFSRAEVDLLLGVGVAGEAPAAVEPTRQ